MSLNAVHFAQESLRAAVHVERGWLQLGGRVSQQHLHDGAGTLPDNAAKAEVKQSMHTAAMTSAVEVTAVVKHHAKGLIMHGGNKRVLVTVSRVNACPQ
jgi:hypothetical protein